jgi:tetratricopeptide (TPR) repeat protein
MLQKIRAVIVLVFAIAGINQEVLGQGYMPKVVQENVEKATTLLREGDTLKAIVLYRNLLGADSVETWKCKILLELANLEFLKDNYGSLYRSTLEEAKECGCDRVAILEKYEFIFIKMKLKGNINYTDSLIELYSRMISLQPDNGLYYFSRFLERKSIDKNLDLAEKDLQLAVKYGNEVAIWYLKRRDGKEAEGK